MLKITQAENGSHDSTLRLEGTLVGPWVGEVRKACEKLAGEGRRLKLDLADLSFADQNGVALLAHLRDRGIELMECSPFVSEQLKPRTAT